MFEYAKDAGLGPRDLSKLLLVTRQTASNWLNGHTSPNKFIVGTVEALLDCAHRALLAGDLPVPTDLSPNERHRKISRVLAKHGWQTS